MSPKEFRAWDRRLKKMFPSVDLNTMINTGEKWDLEDLDWLQYTGLTDKSGQKIYEGDIVAFRLDFDTVSCKEVVFDNGAFRVGDKLWTISDHIQRYECEVIGNIYQNEDLLSESQR